MRVTPDDEVFRINAVFLGPKGYALPWAARYVAYGVGLGLFVLIILVEALLPFRDVGIPPVWEVCLAVLGTYGVMTVVDHDRPVKSVWQTAKVEARTARRTMLVATPRARRYSARVKIKGK